MESTFVKQVADALLKPSVQIISHNDLDGIVSAQLLYYLRCGKLWPAPIYMDYTDNVMSEIEKAVHAQAGTVVVTDYSITGIAVDQFREIISRYPDIEFVWIDHHETNKVDMLDLQNLHAYVYRGTEERCAADLVHTICSSESFASLGIMARLVLSSLAGLAHSADFYNKEDRAAMLMADLSIHAGTEYLDMVIDDIIKHPAAYIDQIKNNRLHEAPLLDCFARRIQSIKDEMWKHAYAEHRLVGLIGDGGVPTKMVVAVCQGYGNYIAEKFGELYPDYPLAIFDINSGGRPFSPKISFRRNNKTCGYDLAELAKRYGGGGHAYAAGTILDNTNFFSQLTDSAEMFFYYQYGDRLFTLPAKDQQ